MSKLNLLFHVWYQASVLFHSVLLSKRKSLQNEFRRKTNQLHIFFFIVKFQNELHARKNFAFKIKWFSIQIKKGKEKRESKSVHVADDDNDDYGGQTERMENANEIKYKGIGADWKQKIGCDSYWGGVKVVTTIRKWTNDDYTNSLIKWWNRHLNLTVTLQYFSRK